MSEGTRKAYISYSHEADKFLNLRKLLRAHAPNGWEIRYDETEPVADRSISAFEHEVSEANQIIFFLSDAYLKSIYCIRELLKTYNKRAGELLPIVIFVGGLEPKGMRTKEIVNEWHGKPEKERPDGIEDLDLALAWLLGPYDEKANNWDTLFFVFDGNDQGIEEKVSNALQCPRKPRYRLPSRAARFDWILNGIRDAVTWHDSLSKIGDDIASQLEDGQSPVKTGILRWLIEIDRILGGYRRGQRQEQLDVAEGAEKLVGYIILLAVDHRRLQMLVHWLNRQQIDAVLKLHGTSDCAFQLIVSAIQGSPALFRYYSERDMQHDKEQRDQKGKKNKELQALMGKGELTLHERGLCEKNYYDTLKSEQNWLEVYQELERQFSALNEQSPGSYSDEKAVCAAITGFLGDDDIPMENAYYLLYDGRRRQRTKLQRFRRTLNHKFPRLTQLDSIPKKESENESEEPGYTPEEPEYYLIDEMHSARINQMLITIYSKIDQVRSWTNQR